MGDDAAVVQAARVSFGRGTRRLRDDGRLIDYLMRHRPPTPFEMCELKVHVKLPIFVARQWIRHRTANVNEMSARYSVLDREFHVPDAAHLRLIFEERREQRSLMGDLFEEVTVKDARSALAGQSSSNKQGREGELSEDKARKALSRIDWISKNAYGVYESLLKEEIGLSREIARAVLPVNYFTEFYWKIDLHNLLHFLSLRSAPGAQAEIRAYADVLLDAVRRWVPAVWAAFERYRLGGAALSKPALEAVRRMVRGETVMQEDSGLSPGEWRELRAALGLED